MLFKKSIEKVKEQNLEELFKKKGVEAVAIGNKIVNGKDTGEKSISVFVKTKMADISLLKSERIPKTIGGYKTDVIDMYGTAEPLHRKKHRPLVAGVSGMVEGGTACSIGLIAYKNGNPVILTNDHCVSYQGKNNIGKCFLNPSPADGGTLKDSIGKIISAPIIKKDEINKIDSAIIPIEVDYDLSVFGLGDYPKKWVKPKIGMKFKKIGRTTGVTEGVITHIDAIACVNYKGDLGICTFRPCIFALQENYNIVNGGDSGSCIFNEEGVIGQTFAATSGLAIFLTGEVVGKELGIDLEKKEPIEGYVALEKSWITDEEVLVNGLNFRKEPNIDNNVIGKLNKGDKIKVVEYAGFCSGYHWLRVLTNL